MAASANEVVGTLVRSLDGYENVQGRLNHRPLFLIITELYSITHNHN
jgi:hypothetical protein